jgi:hypothetical protein
MSKGLLFGNSLVVTMNFALMQEVFTAVFAGLYIIFLPEKVTPMKTV